MPSSHKMTNGTKEDSEGSGFFGKVKRRLTKSRQKQNGADCPNMSSHNKCYRDSSHEGDPSRHTVTINGLRNQNDKVSTLRSDSAGNRNVYDELPDFENGSTSDKYHEQGARPKCSGARESNTFVQPSLGESCRITEEKVKLTEDVKETTIIGNTGNYMLAQDEQNDDLPVDSETERLDYISKDSLKPLVQMVPGLPSNINTNHQICEIMSTDKSHQPLNEEFIAENGQIAHVAMYNIDGDGDDDVFIQDQDVVISSSVCNTNVDQMEDNPCMVLRNIDNTAQKLQSDDNTETLLDSKTTSDIRHINGNANQNDHDTVQVPPRPKRPPRPLSLNFDLRIPPPIPPRSPLSRSFSLTEPSSSPTRFAPDTSILEDGSPSHIMFPLESSILKGSSKSLPQSPTSSSPSSPLDKTRKQKSTNRFSWFHKGKNSKDRNTVHMSMMMNRSLPDIPDEEIQQQKTRSKSYHQLSCEKHKRPLPIRPNDASGFSDSGPRSPRSPTESDFDPSKFTSSLRKLSECGWYWGPMNWDDAEAKLADTPDGAFLVRDSSNERYILSLSFRSQGTTHHTRIEHSQGMFGFWSQPQSHGSASIVEFIEKAMQHSKNGKFLYFLRPRFPGAPPVPVQLTKPISRFKRVQTLQHMCRFLIRRLVRIDHIQTLPLPRRVKEYLLEGQYYTREDVEPIEEQENEEEV
ncbi:uncharacterized protein LOC144450730 [Glandiceps talaboti]